MLFLPSITPRTLLIGVCIAALVVVFSAFAYTRVWAFISGPGLVVESPAAQTSTAESILTVSGYAPRATEISINGARHFLTESGSFSDRVPLSDGYNIVSVTAADRFGTTETEHRTVMYNKR